MYAGHFAAGLALKAREPRAPTWALLVGVGLLDLLFPAFVLTGIEHVTPTPGVPPGMSLDFIDWSHSLVMSLVWSVLFALLLVRRGRAVAAVCGLAVFSHFVLDLPMHPQDMALWPHSTVHLGFGLWRSLPIGWWFVEGAVVLAGCGYYFVRARRDGKDQGYGGRPLGAVLVVLIIHLLNSPWILGRG
jgi:membrane-bound metal-dependent hydrolase YbcI (DUF457 family)